jgi:hypothetical protein
MMTPSLATCRAPTDHELASCANRGTIFVIVLIGVIAVGWAWYWWQIRRHR